MIVLFWFDLRRIVFFFFVSTYCCRVQLFKFIEFFFFFQISIQFRLFEYFHTKIFTVQLCVHIFNFFFFDVILSIFVWLSNSRIWFSWRTLITDFYHYDCHVNDCVASTFFFFQINNTELNKNKKLYKNHLIMINNRKCEIK